MSRKDDPDLGTTSYVNLTTYRRNGTPVTTPVWIVARGDHFYVGTTRDTGKAKRLRADPRVRLIPCNHNGSREFGAAYEGTAHQVDDAALRAEVQGLLRAKYGRAVFAGIMLLYRLRGRYHQRMVLELDLKEAA